MGFDEQRTAAETVKLLNSFPRIFRVVHRICADQGQSIITKVRCYPNRTIDRVVDVGTTTWMRCKTFSLGNCNQFTFFRIDNHDLAASVSRSQEVTVCRIESTIVQEALGLDRGCYQIVDVRIVNQKHTTGFLDVHDKLRTEVRGNDSRHTWLRMVFLIVIGHATGGHDF